MKVIQHSVLPASLILVPLVDCVGRTRHVFDDAFSTPDPLVVFVWASFHVRRRGSLITGGVGDVAPHGSGGLGAEGGSLGNGRYVARLSEGRESSGRATESTLLNLLFVPDGRFVISDQVLWPAKSGYFLENMLEGKCGVSRFPGQDHASQMWDFFLVPFLFFSGRGGRRGGGGGLSPLVDLVCITTLHDGHSN